MIQCLFGSVLEVFAVLRAVEFKPYLHTRRWEVISWEYLCVDLRGVSVWKSDDNLGCWFSPSTFFETGSLFFFVTETP